MRNYHPNMEAALRAEIELVRAHLIAGRRPAETANLLHAQGLGAIQIMFVFKTVTGASLADLKSFGQWWGPHGVTDEAAFNAWGAEVFSRAPGLLTRPHEPVASAGVQLEPLRPDRLDAFGELLGGQEFGGCFCAVWTSHDDHWAARCQDPARPNFAITASRVRAGHEVGFLVLQGAQLVGWTGTGPKANFPFLMKKLASRLSPPDETVWAIGCIAIRQGFRGRGLSSQIVDAIITLSRQRGARLLEAYPTRPWDEPRSYRGSEAVFRRAGFQEIAKEHDGESEVLLMQRHLDG